MDILYSKRRYDQGRNNIAPDIEAIFSPISLCSTENSEKEIERKLQIVVKLVTRGLCIESVDSGQLADKNKK